MRKLLLSILLATAAATPALAQPTDREDREAAREERRSERAARAAARSEASEPRQAPSAERRQRVEAREGAAESRQQRADARQQRADQRSANVNERGRPTLEERQQARQDRADSRSQWQQQAELARRPVRPPAGASPNRPAPPPPQAEAGHRAPSWSTTHWRHDHRYDWRNYRDRNRSLFRLGFYFDPFGWNYNRWGIGWRLWPSYYDRNYWLRDPWMYRLPYAPWPYQWIRYWDDALLVNTITGQVVDAEYNFFW